MQQNGKMNNKYQAVVIGLGNIGARFSHPDGKYPFNHSSAYMQNNKTELIAGVDLDEKNRTYFEKHFQRPTYKTIEDVLSLKPDIVSICSPHELHFEQTIACLKAGIKMIWLEKPPSSHLDEFHKLQEEETKTGAKILVNYQRRYSLNYKTIRDLFKSEKLGKPKAIQVCYSRGLLTNGCHMLDIAFFISQDHRNIELKSVAQLSGSDNPSFSFTTKGFPVFVAGFDLPYHCVDLVAFFEKGRATIDHLGLNSKLETVMENEFFPGFYRLTDAPPDLQLPSPGLSIYFAIEALDDLIHAYEHDKHPVSSLETASQTQELIEMIHRQI